MTFVAVIGGVIALTLLAAVVFSISGDNAGLYLFGILTTALVIFLQICVLKKQKRLEKKLDRLLEEKKDT